MNATISLSLTNRWDHSKGMSCWEVRGGVVSGEGMSCWEVRRGGG